MGLFARFFPANFDDPRISCHEFEAALADYAQGYTTRNQLIVYYSFDTQEATQLDLLLDAVDALSTNVEKLAYCHEVANVMQIAEVGAKYTTKNEFETRLGLTTTTTTL